VIKFSKCQVCNKEVQHLIAGVADSLSFTQISDRKTNVFQQF